MSQPESLRPITASMVAMMEEAANRYRDGRSPEVDEYLHARGIAPETADTFRLGVVDDPAPGHEHVRGWLSIPYLGLTPDGEEQVWSIRFRCLPEILHGGYTCKELSHGKYKGLPHEWARVYNVRAIPTAGSEIHVAEGELDAVILNQAGYPAIGLPGATQWRRHHARMLAGFSKIYVWGDPDEAGAKLVGDIMSSCRNAAPVPLQDGDVGETFLAGCDGDDWEGGYAALDELIREVKWG